MTDMYPHSTARPHQFTTAQIHVLDWYALAATQQHQLTETCDADAIYSAIPTWASQHWRHLCQQFGAGQVLLVHPPQQVQAGRTDHIYIVSQQVGGWLYHAYPHVLQNPVWDTHATGTLQQAAQAAWQRGFCAADVGILAVMGLFAAWEDAHHHLPTQFARCASAFPRMGDPHQHLHPFAPLYGSREESAHYRLYAVMGDSDWLLRCLQYGVRTVQLRCKQPASDEQLAHDIAVCAHAARQHQAHLFINDHWHTALDYTHQFINKEMYSGLYGVHLGQEDLHAMHASDLAALQCSGLRLGISTHSLWELACALHLRPSYIACGPIYATTTKDMPWWPLGNHNISWWRHIVHHAGLPLVAIGGLNPERARTAASAGADLLAVVSHITQSPSPVQAVRDLQHAIAQGHALYHAHTPEHTCPDWPAPTLVPSTPAA